MSEPARDDHEAIQEAEARAVAEIVQRDERQKALAIAGERSPRRASRGTSVAAILVGSVAIALWVVNPPWLRMSHHEAPTRQQVERSGRVRLFMIATRLEEYRTLRGHLPASLGEIGQGAEGVGYDRLDNGRYQLHFQSPEGVELAYDSAQNMSSFLGNTLGDLGVLGEVQ